MTGGEMIERLPERDVVLGVQDRLVRAHAENALAALTWLVDNGQLTKQLWHYACQAHGYAALLARKVGV